MPLPRNTHVHLAAAGDSAAGGAKPEPENFSREYVKELREESARYRTRAQDAEAKIKEAEQRAALAAQALVEAEAKVRAGDERFLLAELVIALEIGAEFLHQHEVGKLRPGEHRLPARGAQGVAEARAPGRSARAGSPTTPAPQRCAPSHRSPGGRRRARA